MAESSTQNDDRAMAAGANLGSAFAKLFAGGVVGKTLGLIRELALAASFGTGAAAASFRAAQTATLIPTHFFASDTLNAGFIPLCSRYLREDPDRARSLFWSVFLLMNAIGVAVAVLLFIGADVVAAALVPGFADEHRSLTAAMIRAMAVGVPFYVQAALASYVEMAHGRYFVASMRAGIQNVGLIAGIGLAALTGNALLLGWGFTIYAILFAALGLFSVSRAGLLGPPAHLMWSEARTVLREFAHLIAPLLLLPLIQQGAIAVERIVASLISTGAVAATDYARTIADSGLVLVAVPLGMAGLAELGRVDATVARDKLRRLIPLLLLVTVPCSLFLVLNAGPIVRLLFGRGRFDEQSVAITSLILMGLAIGFWAQVTGYVLAKALSAQQRNRRVAASVGIAGFAQAAFSIAAFRLLGPLALGLAASVNGILLLALTSRALGLGVVVLRSVMPLAAGAAAYLPLAIGLRATGHDSLFVSAATFIAFWTLLIGAIPRLRGSAAYFIRVPAFGRAP